MAAKVDTELCTGCGACVEAYPVEALSLDDGEARLAPTMRIPAE
jgi:ferredoxin